MPAGTSWCQESLPTVDTGRRRQSRTSLSSSAFAPLLPLKDDEDVIAPRSAKGERHRSPSIVQEGKVEKLQRRILSYKATIAQLKEELEEVTGRYESLSEQHEGLKAASNVCQQGEAIRELRKARDYAAGGGPNIVDFIDSRIKACDEAQAALLFDPDGPGVFDSVLVRKVDDLTEQLSEAHGREVEARNRNQAMDAEIRDRTAENDALRMENGSLRDTLKGIHTCLASFLSELHVLRRCAKGLRCLMRYMVLISPGGAWCEINKKLIETQSEAKERVTMAFHDETLGFASRDAPHGAVNGQGQSYPELLHLLNEAYRTIEAYRKGPEVVSVLRREIRTLAEQKRQADQRYRAVAMKEEARERVRLRIEATQESVNQLVQGDQAKHPVSPARPTPLTPETTPAKPSWNSSTKTTPAATANQKAQIYTEEEIEGLFECIARLKASNSALSAQICELRSKLLHMGRLQAWVQREKRAQKLEREERVKEQQRLEEMKSRAPRSAAHDAMRLNLQVNLLRGELQELRGKLREETTSASAKQDWMSMALAFSKQHTLALAQELNRERETRISLTSAHAEHQLQLQATNREKEEAQRSSVAVRRLLEGLQARTELLASEITASQHREGRALALVDELQEKVRALESEGGH